MWTRRNLLCAGAGLGIAALLPARPSWAATDQLRLALPREPPGLDPTIDADAMTQLIAHDNLFEGLTRVDDDGKVQAGLAASWTISPDGRAYSFKLQPEVLYHDGTSFDAEHVVFSFNRLLAPNSAAPRKSLYGSIAHVVAPDEATVEITLKHPDRTLLFNLGRSDAAIVAPESADNNRNVPIGTGPFVYMQWDRGRDLVLPRNEDYWGVHPRINQVTILFASDAAAALAALVAGQLDGLPAPPDTAALAAVRDNPAVQLIHGTGPDSQPRISAWSSKLIGLPHNAPVEGCPLAGIRWVTDTAPAQSGAGAMPGATVDD